MCAENTGKTDLITDRKRSEEALRKSEERYRRLVEAVTHYVYTVRVENGQPVETIHNQAAVGVTGYTPEEFSADPYLWIRLVPEVDHPAVHAHVSRILGGAETDVLRHRIVRKDGTMRWVRSTLVPHQDGDGNLLSYDGLLVDITDRMEAEESLKESEDRYRSLFETAGDAIFILEVSEEEGARFLKCNGRTMKLFGCTHEDEIIGKRPEDFSPRMQPDGRPSAAKVRELIPAIIKGRPQRFEWMHTRMDGTLFNVEVVLNRIGVQGRLLVLAAVRDITDRKRAEAELADREDRLRTIVATSKDAMIAIDSSGLIQVFNPAAEEMFGHRRDDVIGRPLDNLMPARYRADHSRDVAGFFATGKPDGVIGRTIEVPATRASGEEFPIEISLAAGGEGANRFVLGVIRDITERRKLEEQLRQSQRLDSLGHLAGGVAHDFNNMLGGIMGAADLLSLRTADDGHSRRLVNLIIDTSERARDLTDKLLAFSRKGKVVSQPVDVHKAMGDAVEILARSIDRRIKITSHLDAEKAVVQGDLTQIQNAILNLGINARDAMPEGGFLTLSTENTDLDEAHCAASPFDIAPGRYVCICVRDTGHGMSPEIQSRVFDPFFTTKGVGEGTGLGLSAAYGTVREHHGSITVQSEPGSGTLFKICLPVSQVRSAPSVRKEVGLQRGSGCVLVVEDEHVVRAMAELMLQDLGYDVLIAEDGFAGVEMFRRYRNKINVVILDMLMPRMSGREAFRDIRSIDPQAKVLLSSGFARDAGVSELIKEGLSGFLKKPYHREELAQALHSVLHPDKRQTGKKRSAEM